jgi:hypothetical protein
MREIKFHSVQHKFWLEISEEQSDLKRVKVVWLSGCQCVFETLGVRPIIQAECYTRSQIIEIERAFRRISKKYNIWSGPKYKENEAKQGIKYVSLKASDNFSKKSSVPFEMLLACGKLRVRCRCDDPLCFSDRLLCTMLTLLTTIWLHKLFMRERRYKVSILIPTDLLHTEAELKWTWNAYVIFKEQWWFSMKYSVVADEIWWNEEFQCR